MLAIASKPIQRVGICLLLVLVCIFACITLLQNSQWTFSKIEQAVQTASGFELNLTDRAALHSYLPVLGVSIPSAVMRATDVDSNLQRIRLDGVDLSLPYSVLFGKPIKNLVVEVDTLSVIVELRETAKETTENDIDIENLEELITSFFDEYSETGFDLSIEELQLIVRSPSGASTVYLADSSRVLFTPDDFTFSGNIQASNLKGNVVVNHRFMSKVDGYSSALTVELSPEANTIGSYKLSSVQTIRDKNITIEEVNVTGPQLDVFGQLSVSFENRYRVQGNVDLRQFDVASIPEFVFNEIAAASGDDVSRPVDELLFSEEPVDLGQYADVDFSVSFGAVRLNDQPIITGDVLVKSTLDNTSITGKNLLILGGQGDFKLLTETLEDGGQQLRIDSHIDDAQLSRLQISSDEGLLFTQGLADMKVSLRSAGYSEQELARSLNGYFMLASSNVEVSQPYAEVLDRGVVSSVINGIDNFRKTHAVTLPIYNKDPLPLSCASLRLVVNEGRVEAINGLVVELPDNVLISSGFVDLHTEKIGFAFRTKKKKLLDWSALSLVKFVRLGGNLSEPKFVPNRSELIKEGLLTSSSVLVGLRPSLVYRLAEAGMQSSTRIECREHINN